jgi:hypothetical protein
MPHAGILVRRVKRIAASGGTLPSHLRLSERKHAATDAEHPYAHAVDVTFDSQGPHGDGAPVT